MAASMVPPVPAIRSRVQTIGLRPVAGEIGVDGFLELAGLDPPFKRGGAVQP